MAEERNLFQGPEFPDCNEHYDSKAGDATVDIIQQLLQSGQSFMSEKAEELDLFHHQMLNPVSHTVTALTAVKNSAPQTQVSAAAIPAEPSLPVSTPSKAKKSKALKYKCETCCQVFDSRIALSIHAGRIHKSDGRDKNYQCPYCTKSFFNSSYLSQHMRIHTGVKPYECSKCLKSFKQLSHLQQHERTHSGEKPYRCKEPGCTKAFSQLSNLQSHTRSHLPDGNVHKCTSCYKCYYDEASLNAHLRTHMVNKRVRNYVCDECGKSYTQDTYLQNHIKNKHAGVTAVGVATANALQQPQSIQAVENMICKVEEQPAACHNTPLIQQQQSSQQEVMNKLMSPASNPSAVSSTYTTPEGSYHRLAAPHLFPSTARRQYEDHCSAFKPLPRLGLHGLPGVSGIHGMEGSAPELARQRNPSSSGHTTSNSAYELLSNNILPLSSSQDSKSAASERRQEGMDRFWKLRSNISAAVYPSLNSQIQSYMVGSGGYGNAYTPGYTHEALYNSDKAHCFYQHDKSSMFDNDSTIDYFNGGLRDAYTLD